MGEGLNLPALKEPLLERVEEAGLELRSDIRRWERGSGYLERATQKRKQKKTRERGERKISLFLLQQSRSKLMTS